MKSSLPVAISTLLITMISCRPVMTIGWQEILILAVILALLFGPVLFRVYRRWEEFQKWRRQGKDE